MRIRPVIRRLNPRRILCSLLAGVVVTAMLGVSTEQWRVFGIDFLPRPELANLSEPQMTLRLILWVLGMGSLFHFTATLAAKSRRAWLLLLLYVPAFFVARNAIIESRLRDSIVSCANHSSVWWMKLLGPVPSPLTNSTEFAHYLDSLWGSDLRMNGARCPGYKLAKTKTGVVYVGGGLSALRPGQELLIAFCAAVSHPPPHDHQHCVILTTYQVGGNVESSMNVECTDITEMIRRIEAAIEDAKSGNAPYSLESQTLMRSELAIRRTMIGTGN